MRVRTYIALGIVPALIAAALWMANRDTSLPTGPDFGSITPPPGSDAPSPVATLRSPPSAAANDPGAAAGQVSPAQQARLIDLARRVGDSGGDLAGTPFEEEYMEILVGHMDPASAMRWLADSGHANEAIVRARVILRAAPDSVDALEILARGLPRTSDAEAARYYQRLSELTPGSATPWVGAGARTYLLEPDEALAILSKGVTRFPTNPALHGFTGMAYERLMQYDDALDAYTRASDLAGPRSQWSGSAQSLREGIPNLMPLERTDDPRSGTALASGSNSSTQVDDPDISATAELPEPRARRDQGSTARQPHRPSYAGLEREYRETAGTGATAFPGLSGDAPTAGDYEALARSFLDASMPTKAALTRARSAQEFPAEQRPDAVPRSRVGPTPR